MLKWISEKTKIKKSYLVWLGAGYFIQLLIGLLSFDLLAIIWFFGSVLVIGHVIDGFGDDESFPWPFWFPIIWIILIICGICYLLYLVFRKPFSLISKAFKEINRRIDE